MSKAATVGMGAAALLGVYLRWMRPHAFSWGATGGEVSRAMAGDQFCPHPQLNATRAVTIAAGPEDIWPWLVQWGWNRAVPGAPGSSPGCAVATHGLGPRS